MPHPDLSRMKDELSRLVSINSENPPGCEREAAALVGALCERAGFATRLDEYKSGRVNVLAELRNGEGPVFAFNTHLDVVPAGDGWSGDPFQLREQDGKLIGRGSCDAKGPLIAMLEAMRLMAGSRSKWKGTLRGIFVADEEAASEGAKHYSATRSDIDYVVVGEPTSNGTVIAHKGSLRPIVRVMGISAHSGTPDLGDNAIFASAKLLALVEDLHANILRHRKHPLVGHASITVTRTTAGIADNVVPDVCDLMLDRRLIPGEAEQDAVAELERLLQSARETSGVNAKILRFQATTGGATETPRDEPIVQASLDASRKHGSKACEPMGFQGGCDLVHFRSMGAKGTVIGPGSLAVAHKPDEFVPIEEFVAASYIYHDIAQAMLQTSPS